MGTRLTYKQLALLEEMYKIGSVTVTYNQLNGKRRAEWTEAIGKGWRGVDAEVPVRTLDALHHRDLVSETSELIGWRRTHWYKINAKGCELLGVEEKIDPVEEVMYQQGLIQKYKVEKTNGEPVDPAAKYFVLRLDTDKAARQAMMVYAKLTLETNETLSTQIAEMLFKLDPNTLFSCPKCDGLGWRGPSTGKQSRCPLCTPYR
jgi:hypothetical protein